MPMVCSVCRHDERDELDRQIVAGVSIRDIAGRFGLSRSAVGRHASSHVVQLLSRAAGAEAVTADLLLAELRTLRTVTLGILADAQGDGDHAAALGAVKRLESQADLCARLAGELVERREVSVRAVLMDSEWLKVRAAILAALLPFPDAAGAVASALRLVEVPRVGG